MFYEINIALNGSHYFATAPRSLTSAYKTATVLTDLIKRFPASEGFTISASVQIEYGVSLSNCEGLTNTEDEWVKQLNNLTNDK